MCLLPFWRLRPTFTSLYEGRWVLRTLPAFVCFLAFCPCCSSPKFYSTFLPWKPNSVFRDGFSIGNLETNLPFLPHPGVTLRWSVAQTLAWPTSGRNTPSWRNKPLAYIGQTTTVSTGLLRIKKEAVWVKEWNKWKKIRINFKCTLTVLKGRLANRRSYSDLCNS